jgi:hypothetical protein
MAATSINFATPAGQIEWHKSIQNEQKTRASWLAKYGPEEFRPPPRMVKVNKAMPAPLASDTPADVVRETTPEKRELSYQEVLKQMQFSTNTADSFWDMHDTPLYKLARQSIQAGKFNRRKSLNNL